MTDKTLGQVAFWRFHYERGDLTVEQVELLWRAFPQYERDSWQAAAEAVLAMQRQQTEALVTKWRTGLDRSVSAERCADDLERVLQGGE